MKLVPSDEDITNPSNDELLELINYGHEAVCPNCETEGEFDITMIVFDDLYFEPFEEPRNGILRIEIEKKNGALTNTQLQATFNGATRVDVLNGITVIKRHIDEMNEDSENSDASTNHFVKADNGSCFFSAKFKEEPPYVISWGGSNYGLSYDEIYREIENIQQQYRL